MAHRSSFVSVFLLGHGHYTGFLLPSSYDSLRCPSHYIYKYGPFIDGLPMKNGDFLYIHIYIWLVVEPYPSEKWWSESQLGWLHSIPNMMGKIIHSCSKPPTSIVNLQIFESWIFRVHSSFWMTSYLTIKSSSPSHWLPRVPHTAAFSMPFLPVGHDPNAARGPVWREKWAGGPTQLMVRRRQKYTADPVW